MGLSGCMKVGFLTAKSLKKYIWQFRQALVSDPSFHIFGLAETKLGPEVDDCHVDIPGYSVLRQDRNLGGGGDLLYVKKNQKAKRGKPSKIELIFCPVCKLHYRPPHVPLRSDRQLLHLLRSTCPEYSHKVIMGD